MYVHLGAFCWDMWQFPVFLTMPCRKIDRYFTVGWYSQGWVAVIVFVTVASYLPLTIVVTEWRGRVRKKMNALDNAMGARATDMLLTYETVGAPCVGSAPRAAPGFGLRAPPSCPRHFFDCISAACEISSQFWGLTCHSLRCRYVRRALWPQLPDLT